VPYAFFSALTGTQAHAAARSAAEFLKPGAWYFDLATVTRAIAEADAAAIEAAGGRYIDVAVLGSFLGSGYRAPMLLAGADAEEAASWLRGLGFDVRVLGPVAGTASGLKLVRSILMKGLEALSVECLVAADRQGIVAELLDNVSDADRTGFRPFMELLVRTHLVHARRRLEEMEMVERMLDDIGMEPLMTAATIRVHRRTVEAGAAPADGVVPDLDRALAVLVEEVVRPRGGNGRESGSR
jgi:3-hydroxyisobutyrate dehydrogenase